MSMNSTRRSILQRIGFPVLTAVSGCVADYPPSRVLDIWEIESSRTNSTRVLNVTVRARNNLEPGGFHNVRVVGYSKSNKRVCSKKVGDLSVGTESSQRTVSLECSVRPHIVGLIAEETPCEENTHIEFREYNTSKEIWEPKSRKCEEDLFSE
jgi:hypothetical protein